MNTSNKPVIYKMSKNSTTNNYVIPLKGDSNGKYREDIDDVEVTITWNGRYYPQTYLEPAEYPEPEIIAVIINGNDELHNLTDSQIMDIYDSVHDKWESDDSEDYYEDRNE